MLNSYNIVDHVHDVIVVGAGGAGGVGGMGGTGGGPPVGVCPSPVVFGGQLEGDGAEVPNGGTLTTTPYAMDFDAGIVVQGGVLDELIGEGFPMLPTQWIETDKTKSLEKTRTSTQF